MCYRSQREAGDQLSGLSWMGAPGGGCSGLVIAGIWLRRAAGYREVTAVTPAGWLPVITVRSWGRRGGGPGGRPIPEMQLRPPPEMGGEGGGTNPEQLFAVGYAACFQSALGVAGRRERAEVGDVLIGSRVSLLPAQDRGFTLAVQLDVTLPQVQDPGQAARIVAAAHQLCPYSRATRGNIDVKLTVNGQDIR